ncbi:hypothetical protein EVAR_62714_1 [Eumeta japonica]|uniref:Uncharacterized protein n=1 Tax=Eumeta variegata TaxID=151549 RepID=A0A4C1Z0D0_EUMVA|nr:hypothetical protein EVAR_62714_1 [Eumeta japonica]
MSVFSFFAPNYSAYFIAKAFRKSISHRRKEGRPLSANSQYVPRSLRREKYNPRCARQISSGSVYCPSRRNITQPALLLHHACPVNNAGRRRREAEIWHRVCQVATRRTDGRIVVLMSPAGAELSIVAVSVVVFVEPLQGRYPSVVLGFGLKRSTPARHGREPPKIVVTDAASTSRFQFLCALRDTKHG